MFDKDGFLVDGQHRIKAISKESDGEFLFSVIRNVPDIVRLKVDQGKKRTIREQSMIAGKAIPPCHIPIFNAMWLPGDYKSFNKHIRANMDKVIELIPRFKSGIDFSLEQKGAGQFENAILDAVIARAFYTTKKKDRDKLARFHVLAKGGRKKIGPLFRESGDEVAEKLFDRLTSKRNGDDPTVYKYVETFLEAYLNGDPEESIKVPI